MEWKKGNYGTSANSLKLSYVVRMPWSSAAQGSASKHDGVPDFLKIAGGLVSQFLQRRKRFSTVLIASNDVSPPNDDDAEDLGNPEETFSTKPSVIAVPTPDGSNATRSHVSGSGSDSGGNNITRGGLLASDRGSKDRGSSTRKRHKTGEEFCGVIPGSQEAQSKVPSKPFQATCYAITSDNGRRCSSLPVSNGRYCEIHAQSISSGENQNRYLSEACDKRERWFYGNEGTMRCLAITASQRRCQEMSVQYFDMCRRHLKYPPKRCYASPENLLSHAEPVTTPEKDDGDESSSGFGDESEDSDLDSDLSVDETSSEDSLASEDSFDDGSSISSSDDEWKGTKATRGVKRPHASLARVRIDRPTKAKAKANHTRRGKEKPKGEIVAPSKLQTRRVKSSAKCGSLGVEPTEFDHSKDKLFSGKGNQLQCHFEASDGQKCPYQRKRGTDIYCYGHDVLTPHVLARMARSGVTVDPSDDDSSTDGITSDENKETCLSSGTPRTYTHKEFVQMWKKFEEFYMSTDEIENSKQIRGANQSMSPDDTDGQAKAQYGRLLPLAMKRIIDDILGLGMGDVFLDIGHGIGNTCMHAAFTVGCEARGIEVVYSRNFIATAFRDNLVSQHHQFGSSRIAGEVNLRHGRLEDEVHRDFLTKGVTKAIVNNFNGVFAERSVKNKSLWFLDDYCAGIFGLMAPGTCMVTLHPLSLGHSLEQANAARRKHKLPESSNASFYRVEKVVLGKACDTVKWNRKSGNENLIYVYKYTRLQQEAGTEAVFLCGNPRCKLAMKSVPIPATTFNDDGRCVINRCTCGVAAKMLRQRKRVTYS